MGVRVGVRDDEHEIDKGDADEAEAAPDEEDLGAEVGVVFTGVDEVGCCVCLRQGVRTFGGL